MIHVAISAGHNPEAQGARFNGVTEYDKAVEWVDALEKRLLTYQHRITVHRIPTGSLTSKVAAVNRVPRLDLALEIHFNACGVASVRGCETLYCPGSLKGKQYAEAVQNALVCAIGTKDRGVKEGWYKQDRPGVVDWHGDRDGDETILYFLRKTRCPALVLEPEFLSQLTTIDKKRDVAMRTLADWMVYNL